MTKEIPVTIETNRVWRQSPSFTYPVQDNCDIKCNKFTYHSLVSHIVCQVTKHMKQTHLNLSAIFNCLFLHGVRKCFFSTPKHKISSWTLTGNRTQNSWRSWKQQQWRNSNRRRYLRPLKICIKNGAVSTDKHNAFLTVRCTRKKGSVNVSYLQLWVGVKGLDVFEGFTLAKSKDAAKFRVVFKKLEEYYNNNNNNNNNNNI